MAAAHATIKAAKTRSRGEAADRAILITERISFPGGEGRVGAFQDRNRQWSVGAQSHHLSGRWNNHPQSAASICIDDLEIAQRGALNTKLLPDFVQILFLLQRFFD